MTITPQQALDRKIGGSDVAAIFGIDAYRQPEELRLELLGRIERTQPTGRAAAYGNLLEEPIAQMYEEATGTKVHKVLQTITVAGHPWLTLHPDRRIVGLRKGLEIKLVGRRMAAEWGPADTDHVSESALLQAQTYMIGTGYPAWDIAAYFGGDDLRIFPLEADSELQQMIIETTREFWEVNVMKDVPCDIDWGHRTTASLLRRMYQLVNDKEVALNEEAARWLKVREEAKERVRAYEQIAEGCELHLRYLLAGAATGVLPDGSRLEIRQVSRKGYEVAPTSYEQMKVVKRK
jgi:putative phage-type endonuclease